MKLSQLEFDLGSPIPFFISLNVSRFATFLYVVLLGFVKNSFGLNKIIFFFLIVEIIFIEQHVHHFCSTGFY